MANPNWIKGGPSPNPSGRTKMTEAQRAARELREAAQPAIARMLIKMALDETADPSHRLIAAKAVLEELPKEVIMDANVNQGPQWVRDLSKEQVLDLLKTSTESPS